MLAPWSWCRSLPDVAGGDRGGERALDRRAIERRLCELLKTSIGPLNFRWRSWRFIAELEGDRIAFVAADESAWKRLADEAELIERLRPALDCKLPEVIFVCEEVRVQVRAMVTGFSGIDIERLVFGGSMLPPAFIRYSESCPITSLGCRLARDLGTALGQFQGAMTVTEARGIGLTTRDSAADFSAIRRVLNEQNLAEFSASLGHLESWRAGLPQEPLPCHGDPHLHNIAIDPDTGQLLGIFDFDESALDHPLSDLRYTHSNGSPFAEIAAASFEDMVGAPAELGLIERFHLLGAFRHLVYVPPTSARFPQIVEWVRAANAAFGLRPWEQ